MLRVLKWIGFGLGGLIGAILVFCLGLYVTDTTYYGRYFSALYVGVFEPPIKWYQPQEKVKGVDAPQWFASGAEGLDPAAVEKVRAYAEQHNSYALIILKDGKLAAEHYWADNRKDKQGQYSRDTVISVHSFVKTLTAMAVGQAIKEGKIASLDLPLSTWLPEWAADARGKITLRRLLEGNSGLEVPPVAFHPWARRIEEFVTTNNEHVLLEIPMGSTAESKNWGHNNMNPALAGLIIERATGERYADFVSRTLWKPLGNADAYAWLDRPGGLAHTECCFLSAVGDWARIGEMLRNKGMVNGRQIMDPAYIAEMLKGTKGNPNYGLQIWLGSPYSKVRPYNVGEETFANKHSEPYLVDDVFFLDGWGNQRAYIVPSKGLTIIRFGTRDESWDDAVLVNTLVKGMR